MCTTLLAGNVYGSTRSLSQFAPAVPERKSSLERKSDNKKQIEQIIEENGVTSENNGYELEKTTVVALIHGSPSPDSGHNTSSSPAESASQNSSSPHEQLEFSESDLDSCDRAERIRTKTEMTTYRIPSMCLITPPQSDDEINLRNANPAVPYNTNYVPYNKNLATKNVLNGGNGSCSEVVGKPLLRIQIPTVPDIKKEVTDVFNRSDSNKLSRNTVKTTSKNGMLETNIDSLADDAKDSLHFVVDCETGYATIKTEVKKTYRSPSPSGGVLIVNEKEEDSKPIQPIIKPSLLPNNFMDRFKESTSKQKKLDVNNGDLDYAKPAEKSPKSRLQYSNDNKSEYVSLNELPVTKDLTDNCPLTTSDDGSMERKKRQGARVTLDSDGRVVYSSDSLKRKKQHTTFVPGKYVRESPTPSPIADKRLPKTIRPVNCSGLIRNNSDDRKSDVTNVSSSHQTGKLIIKAGLRNSDSPTKDFVRLPPARVVTPTNTMKRLDKGIRIKMENGDCLKSETESTESSETNSLERAKHNNRRRSSSPSSSSSSSDTHKKQVDIRAAAAAAAAVEEEGKILNENDLDALGENSGCDFINPMKLNVGVLVPENSLTSSDVHQQDVPHIFQIEPQVKPCKKQIKRSDSYRIANNTHLTLPIDPIKFKLTTVNETIENVDKCKITANDPNYNLLMTDNNNDKHNRTITSNKQQNFKTNSYYSRNPYKVTKPTDIELAKVLKKTITNDTEIW